MNEGVGWFLREAKEQVIFTSLETFTGLIEKFESKIAEVDISNIKYGPFAIGVKDTDVALIAWKGRKKSSLLIGKEELTYLSYLIKNNLVFS